MMFVSAQTGASLLALLALLSPSTVSGYNYSFTNTNSSTGTGTGDASNGTITVDCSNFRAKPIELVSGLVTMHAIVNPVDQVLTAELIYEGQGWLALAFTEGGSTQMIGAEAVIGLPDAEVSSTNPGKYGLGSLDPSGTILMDSSRQTLTNADIVQNSTHTVLTFTKPLVESGEHELFSTAANTLLWAVGGSNDLLFHVRRGDVTLKFRQCTVISDTGVVTSGTDTEAGVVSVSDDNHNMWVAHGACAAVAWAILVPLAVGASLIRSLLEFMGLPKGMWYSIHRGLNMIAAILTICSFAIAVYLFNEQPGATNFTELTHHTLGLVIFILTLLQAMSGIFRPHLPHANLPTVHIDADYESNLEMEESPKTQPAPKSTQRVMWEYGHRIVGVAILAMAWWEIQDGIALFLQRFPDAYNFTTVFWAVVISITSIFAILFAYQTFGMTKTASYPTTSPDKDDAGVPTK